MLRLAYVPEPVGHTRIAYALSKRVGNAVQRNRIRRRLRSVFATLDADDGVVFPEGTYLVGATREAVDAPYEVLMSTASALLQQVAGRGAPR